MKKLFLLPLLLLLFPSSAAALERSVPNWGLDRLDDEAALDGSFRSLFDGAGVDVYILDTGVGAHSQLGSRVEAGWSAWGDDGRTDCNGQGTASAIVAAGSSWGVAPGAKIYPVRALDCNRVAPGNNMSAGIDWVIAHHTSRPAVLIVGGSVSLDQAIGNKIASLEEEGVLTVAAAGDVFADACTRSPASAALAVGSVRENLSRSPTSGFGSCLDLWAPGEDILLPEDGSPAPVPRSGTALSASFVGGLAALALQRRPATSASALRAGLLSRGRPVISDTVGSTDKLLFAADLAYKPGSGRYWQPTVLRPPEFSGNPSATWNLADGFYSDSTTNSTWVRGPVAGTSYNSELVCQLRSLEGQILINWSVGGETEPTSCTLSFGTIEDGKYQFVARKDLIRPGVRVEGRESSAPFELDRQGPQVAWGQMPAYSRQNIVNIPLRIYDRQAIGGIEAADFIQRGTAPCLLAPNTPSLPAGGGEINVQAICTGAGTLQPAVRAGAFFSSERAGPALTLVGGTTVIDFSAPQTTISSGPPPETSAREALFSIQSSEPLGKLECRLNGGAWQECPGSYALSGLQLGSYTLEARASDAAGNVDPSPASWSWKVISEAVPPDESRPANDNWADATVAGFPATYRANNTLATRETGEPLHGAASLWYSWQAPSGGILELSTRGSAFDTTLSIYRGTSLASLRRVDFNDDSGENLWSSLQTKVEGGQKYFIAIASSRNGRGLAVLSGKLSPLPISKASSYISSVRRFPRKGMVRIRAGVDGRTGSETITFQCARTSPSGVPSVWQGCQATHTFRGLRRGARHKLWVRIVVDGTPERRPSSIVVAL